MDPIKWAKLLEKAYNGQSITCPECGGHINAELFARNNNGEKRGFAILECEKCKERTQFSRIKFPEYAVTKEF